MNYEGALTDCFGADEGLGDALRFPVFLSSLTPTAIEALKTAHRKLPKRITTFIRDHDASLPSEVQDNWRYDFRVLLLPQTGPKTEADAVIRFVREEELTDEQRQARDVVQTIIREKQLPVQNKGKYKAGHIAEAVSAELGVKFRASSHHARAWRYYKIRPPGGSRNPEKTDGKYCVWDEPHQDYLYTEAWRKKLIRDLKDPKKFAEVTGSPPVKLKLVSSQQRNRS